MEQLVAISDQQDWSSAQKQAGKRIALVPTLGGLHAGHVALIRHAKAVADVVVVSLFLNPTQFDDPDDLDAYPANRDEDAKICENEGVDAIFCPTAEAMYPNGFASFVEIVGPLVEQLCGATRPGHFRGVATVVTKLFNAVLPDVAVFGQKDLQQVLIINRMVGDLNFPIDIQVTPTVREQDGLALSSRNRRLDQAGRAIARHIPAGLNKANTLFRNGERKSMKLIEVVAEELLVHPGVDLDYAQVVDVDGFKEVDEATISCILAIAVFIDGVRLIDHVQLGGDGIDMGGLVADA